MKKYEALAGEHVSKAVAKIAELATSSGELVSTMFNDVELVAAPGDSPTDIEKYFYAELERRHQEWIASPEYAKQQQEAEEREQSRRKTLDELLLQAPAQMSFKDDSARATWNLFVEKNKDPYGSGVVRYADLWARLMEARIGLGETVEACAADASNIADTEGITGFMYGCAVSTLAACWVHGEQLRRWHNLKSQIGNEGEKANESGGVLNPALLTLGGGQE